MSIRNTQSHSTEIQAALAANGEGVAFVDPNSSELGEGVSGFSNASPDSPLTRKILVGVRASLGQLSTDPKAATWAPSATNIAQILQNRQFTDLQGNIEARGNLKSVVVHSISSNNISSTFPIAIGAHVTGVDDKVFSSQGKSYGFITLPNERTHQRTTLQEEDTRVAYDFARKYPGYTADNIDKHGVHKVNERRFVLISSSHPLVTGTLLHSNSRP